jgi:hypothetical protein
MGLDLKEVNARGFQREAVNIFKVVPSVRLDGICQLRKFYSVLIKVSLFVVTCDISQL